MFHTIKRLLFHPIVIYIIIFALECIPYVTDNKVLHEMPKIGDNFRTFDSESVFYYNGKGKYYYSSGECFASYGNPEYITPASDGGIKIIDKTIVDAIPVLGDMCGNNDKIPTVATTRKLTAVEKMSSTNYLLDHFSEIAHLCCYIYWSLALLFYFNDRKNSYWIVFGISFLGGGVLEFVQMFFIEGRNASFEDQILNCIGATIGMLIFWMLKQSPLWNPIRKFIKK